MQTQAAAAAWAVDLCNQVSTPGVITRVADHLISVAEAFRRAYDGLPNNWTRSYIQAAAERVTSLSKFFRSGSTHQIQWVAEEFAQRQPLLFVTTAGVIAAVTSRLQGNSNVELDRTL